MKQDWRQPKFFTDKVNDFKERNKYTAIVRYYYRDVLRGCCAYVSIRVMRFEGDTKLFLKHYPLTEYILEGWPLMQGQTEEDLLNEVKLKY